VQKTLRTTGVDSYVKQNNNNSEGVDRNEQCECSSNVKDAPPPKWTKYDSIAKVRIWDNTYLMSHSVLFAR